MVVPVEPEVLPDVVPLVEPAFSEVEQALKSVSDEHKTAPVITESHLRFIRQRKCGKEGKVPVGSIAIRALAARFTRILAR